MSKSYVVSKNSSVYKFIQDNTNGCYTIKTVCDYYKFFLKAFMVALSFYILLIGFVVFPILMFLTTVMHGYLIANMVVFPSDDLVGFTWIWASGIVIVFSVFGLIALVINGIGNLRLITTRNQSSKVRTLYKAFKEKFCPLVEFVD